MQKLQTTLMLVFLSATLMVANAQDLKKIDKYLEKSRIDWGVPGMSVALVKDGEVIFNKSYGTLSVDSKTAVDENSLFAIASNTKAFVSTALAVLVDEGKIDWDDKVIDYLPAFKMYDPYVTAEITIRDLLCHRAGLGTFSGDVIWYKSQKPASEIIKQIQYVPQAYSFRSGYGYSNLMFITAGEVIRAVTGKAWDEYVKENFFEPLGMSRTVTSTSSLENMKNVATPHKSVDGENKPIDWVNWDNMGAAGGIISSTADMAKWINFNLNRGIIGNDTILSPDQQNVLWTIHNSFALTENAKEWIPGRHFNGYGLGWGLYDYYGRMVVTHSGGYDGMYSRVAMVPDENFGFVLLTNNMTGIITPMMMYLINSVLEEDTQDWSQKYLDREGGGSVAETIAAIKEAKKRGTQPTLDKKEMIGTYFDPMYGNIHVKQREDKLRLEFEEAPDLSATLVHWHNDSYEISWDQTHAWFDFGIVSFNSNSQLKVEGLTFEVPNYDIFFHEIKPKKID
jgi:CubicO group peptidase (beta-lactamase class C family)